MNYGFHLSLSIFATLFTQPTPVVLSNMVDPVSRVTERVTKKFFGTYVTPASSPVQPERFRGYHTGTDFETTPNEATKDVPVNSICDGTVLVKRWVSGYGGVLIQSCKLDGKSITVLYGHLRLSSIHLNVGDALPTSKYIGVLGTGYSSETDNERKHLHLSIHRGTRIEYRGYVSDQRLLSGWIDFMKVH